MGYEEATELIQVVPLSAGYTATIHVLRADDETELQAILLGARKNRSKTILQGKGDPITTIEQETDGQAYQVATILRGVSVDPVTNLPLWTLDDREGRIWPLDAAHVKKLTAPDFNALFKAIQELGTEPDKSGTGTRESVAADDADSGSHPDSGNGHVAPVRRLASAR